jgi:folate-binding protein YgfZ
MRTPDSAISASPAAYGVLAFRGTDAARFLQGQLSADIEKLVPGARTLAGLHNPQGRVIALLNISRISPDEFQARLPAELLDAVASRLRKYVLRAKLAIEVLPGEPAMPDALEDIRAGVPEVFSATSESFVAQMLNLDLLGAIAFDKGCYTGQEVIARAHYRGRVKRRLQRWLNASGTALKAGDVARSMEGRTLTVVRVADAGNGQQEILAVGTFGGAPEGAVLENAVEEGAEPAAAAGVLVSGPLPLPYSLPE